MYFFDRSCHFHTFSKVPNAQTNALGEMVSRFAANLTPHRSLNSWTFTWHLLMVQMPFRETSITLRGTHAEKQRGGGIDRWWSQNRNQVLKGSEATRGLTKRMSFVTTDTERWIIRPVVYKNYSIAPQWNTVQPLKIGRSPTHKMANKNT